MLAMAYTPSVASRPVSLQLDVNLGSVLRAIGWHPHAQKHATPFDSVQSLNPAQEPTASSNAQHNLEDITSVQEDEDDNTRSGSLEIEQVSDVLLPVDLALPPRVVVPSQQHQKPLVAMSQQQKAPRRLLPTPAAASVPLSHSTTARDQPAPIQPVPVAAASKASGAPPSSASYDQWVRRILLETPSPGIPAPTTGAIG
jgi:hypothetical protein